MRRLKLTKKKIVSLAIVVALLSIAAAGTLAYYTDEVVAHNIITSGVVDITLHDKTVIGGAEVDFPTGGITGVMPGVTVPKLVWVTNEGGDAWVRIRLSERIEAEDGSELPLTLADGTKAYELNFVDDTKWTEGEDGAWYYADPMTAGDVTDKLFTGVTFSPKLGNEYQCCTVYIEVEAEAVQHANNPLPESGYEAILGWDE